VEFVLDLIPVFDLGGEEMFATKFKAIACLSFFVLVLLTPLVHAQSEWTSGSVSEAQLAKLSQEVADAKGSADNAWMPSRRRSLQ
jgi:hypothetical protein